MGWKYSIKYMDSSQCKHVEVANSWFMAYYILWFHKPTVNYYWKILEVR